MEGGGVKMRILIKFLVLPALTPFPLHSTQLSSLLVFCERVRDISSVTSESFPTYIINIVDSTVKLRHRHLHFLMKIIWEGKG